MNVATPAFHRSRCVRYRYRYSSCRRCAEACPHDAIALNDEGMQIDPARCHNCALCATACRTGALVAPNLSRIELLKRLLGRRHVVLGCLPSGVECDEHVPCLGALDATMLAYLSKRGIEVELRGSGHCGDCLHGEAGARALAASLEGVAALAAARVGETWVAPQLRDEAEVPRRSDAVSPERRQLFRRLVGRGLDEVLAAPVAGRSSPQANAIRAGAWFVPEMRELLQLVWQRGEGVAGELAAHPALPVADIRLEGTCNACEACFRVCPTGAVRVREDATTWHLAFAQDCCAGCETCVEVCQTRALRPAPQLRARSGERDWHRLAKQRCERCDRHFVSPEPSPTCPVCADDDSAFHAIFDGN